MDQILVGAALAATASIVAFFGGRYFQKSKVTESLARKNLIMDLISKMKSEGMSDEQLQQVEATFEKTAEIRAVEDRITVESYNFGIKGINEALCQQDMNAAQERRLRMLNAKLTSVTAELAHYLDDEFKGTLKATQRTWEKYRESEAQWATRAWAGGSMSPFIYYGEASRLTVERIAALERELHASRQFFENYGSGDDE